MLFYEGKLHSSFNKKINFHFSLEYVSLQIKDSCYKVNFIRLKIK